MDRPEIIRKYCLDRVGYPYVFATSGAVCTPAMRRERATAKPAYAANIHKYCPVLSGKQATCAGCKYQGKQAYDCRGLTYQACRAAGISISSIGASAQWKGDYWAEKGTIDKLPKNKVTMVFRETASANPMGHTGAYMGDGYVIEARGHAYGVIRGKLESYAWTHYAIPRGLYEGGEPMPVEETLPMLRKGSAGEYVKAAQNLLIQAGFPLPRYGVDGKFGDETEAAVKAFQQANGLKADGVVGPATWAALLEPEEGQDEPQDEPEEASDVVLVPMGRDVAKRMYEALGGALGVVG